LNILVKEYQLFCSNDERICLETIENQILSAINSEDFLTHLYKANLRNPQERTLYAETIANLHNQGKFDAISEFKKINRSNDTYDFYTLRRVFEDILPLIDVPVQSVINSIMQIDNEGAMSFAFAQYCKVDEKRSEEALSIALSNPHELYNFITPAIIAGCTLELSKFVNIAIDLCQHSEIIIRIKTITALGDIDYKENKEVIISILEVIKQNIALIQDDEMLTGTIFRSLFSLYKNKQLLEEEVLELLEKILNTNFNQVHHIASEFLWLYHENMSTTMIDLFLSALIYTSPEHNGTIDNIDQALSALFKRGIVNQTIDCLEKILLNYQQLSIEKFDSLIREISQNNSLLNALITRWFLSGRIRFGRCASDLIRAHGGDDYILSVDLAQIHGQQAGVHYFLAKKACGWFFINPISAASFMISLIDSAPEDEVQAIGELLFNPLLISYSGDLRVYIDEISINSSVKIQKVLSELLVNVETYHNDLQSISKIAELHPSQTQRETYYRHHSELMNESFKNTPKGLLSQLFKPTFLLYGNRSIHYIHHGQNGEKTRQEVPLQSISHSIELPSLDYLNPHGLDEMLRSFKLEGCTS